MFNAPAGSPQTLQVALQYHQAGNFRQAETLYRQILAAEPRHPDALHFLGLLAKQTGHPDAAIQLLSQAIEIKPDSPDALSNLGTTLADLGRFDEAIDCYHKAIALRPSYPETYHNLGFTLVDMGRLDDAINCFREVIALSPGHAEAYYDLCNAYTSKGQLDEAILCGQKAIELKPNFAEAHNNLGIALKDKARLDEAIACFQNAIVHKPDYLKARCNLGNALRETGRLQEAINSYQTAIAISPNSAPVWCNLAIALCHMGRIEDSMFCSRKAIQLQPEFAEAHNSLGHALKDAGLLDEAIVSYRQAVVHKPDYSDAHSNVLMTLNYHPATTREIIFDESVRFARQHAEPLRQFIKPHANDRDPDRRLKIGYVSADLREHAVARFLLPMLAEHDSRAFEIFCYARVTHPDLITGQLREQADTWQSIVGLKDEQSAELIREDKMDILIDLGLHSAHNPLMIFARKPAPVQVTYLAYCSTSGLETMDYRFTDPWLDPPGASDAYYTEQSIHLPQTYWCYPPNLRTPDPGAPPVLRSGHITFASLNNFCKMSPGALKTWCELLRAVPGSEIILHAKAGNHRQRVLNVLKNEGIDPHRLRFVEHLPASDYFREYQNIDIALDPFPYTGGTTTCDALWMGVPVVSLAGETAVSRGGLSILSNVGLPELVAGTTEEYLKIAMDLANDLPRLAQLRSGLRSKMLASPLMDVPRFVRNMESAYRAMWKKWCANVGQMDRSYI